MFRAVELVRQRLDRTCFALRSAGIPYAVIGGNAVAAWVATIDDGAVRNTRDVDILLREQDLELATIALESVGFVRESLLDVILFLDGPEGKPSQGVHVLLAGRKVGEEHATVAPSIDRSIEIEGRSIVRLDALVEMKLNSFRRKDQTHLLDMIQIGLIDSSCRKDLKSTWVIACRSCWTTLKGSGFEHARAVERPVAQSVKLAADIRTSSTYSKHSPAGSLWAVIPISRLL